MSNEKKALSIRLDAVHWELLEGLCPFYGSNKGEVARSIIKMWLASNLGNKAMATLKENKAINLRLK